MTVATGLAKGRWCGGFRRTRAAFAVGILDAYCLGGSNFRHSTGGGATKTFVIIYRRRC